MIKNANHFNRFSTIYCLFSKTVFMFHVRAMVKKNLNYLAKVVIDAYDKRSPSALISYVNIGIILQ